MPREKETKRLSAPPVMNTIPMGLRTSPSAPELGHSNGEIHGCNADTNEVSEEHDPLEIVIIDDVFDFNVDALHKMLFGDHPFYKFFQETKKSSKLVISDWAESEECGTKTRTLTYTVAINHSLGPKSASSTEKQFIRTLTPGRYCVVDAECHTRGLPYGDHFYLLNRFAMRRVSANTTRLVISSQIVYVKKCWGFIKKFIESNVKSGVRESYILLAQLLREEAESTHLQNHNVMEHNKNLINSKRRNSSKTSSRTSSTETTTSPSDTPKISPYKHHTRSPARRCSKLIASDRSESDDTQHNENADKMAKCVLVLLVFLIAIHATLFYKLRVVEEQANILTSNDNIRYLRTHVAPSALDMNEQLNEQMHHSELDTWQHVLTASAELMSNVQESLVQLQADIENKVRHRNTVP